MFIGLSVISILTGTISAQLSSAAIRGNIQSIYDLKPSNIICTPLPLYKTDYLVQYNVGNYVAPTHTLQDVSTISKGEKLMLSFTTQLLCGTGYPGFGTKG